MWRYARGRGPDQSRIVMSVTSPIEYVETLAQALDSDDYATAESVMSADVEYVIGDKTLIGPQAIVASYKTASEMAHLIFDAVAYDHDIVSSDDPTFFSIDYSDILTIDDETLTHMAVQHVRAKPRRGVVHITNVDVPGERERVDAFLERHGRSRDG